MTMLLRALFSILIIATHAHANPYPDPNAVPKDKIYAKNPANTPLLGKRELMNSARSVVRVDVGWDKATDSFKIDQVVRELSGTEALASRSLTPDYIGSYRGVLSAMKAGTIYHSAIGTGSLFRKLSRGLSFRFPDPESGGLTFQLIGEHPVSGEMKSLINVSIDSSKIVDESSQLGEGVTVKLLRAATASPKLYVNVYAEAYRPGDEVKFNLSAMMVVETFEQRSLPMFEHMEFRAVFAPSAKGLGTARDLGIPVAERDSFLGLYFPYWEGFGRWYHVVYPTRYSKYRSAIARVPYDYPIVIMNSGDYFGVGNFMELTAVPARNNSFGYLLMHEFGHFLGLNEEYESGGRTELEFAPQISEPWSQNITFQTNFSKIKWNKFISPNVPLPTPPSLWNGQASGPIGAYPGGYAESPPLRRSHKPAMACTMKSSAEFCAVCSDAIRARITFDLGL